VERRDGAESFWLSSVAFIDLEVSAVTSIPGIILFVVIGHVFHEVAAAVVTGLVIVPIGVASYVLSGIRRIQSYRARREYLRTRPPFAAE
jgi:hypothetical protein